MSSDNCIAILITKDKFKKEGNCHVNMFESRITAYRVGHIFAVDNFDWYIENEIHNLGYWMNASFPNDEVVYSEDEAFALAKKYKELIGYTEYGIVEIDASKYNFPGY